MGFLRNSFSVMPTLKCTIAYDGSKYLGWQKTKEGPSIEESLETAFAVLLKQRPKIEAASRTDAGVHARGQVVHFSTHLLVDTQALKRKVNGLLPHDISVYEITVERESFHATFDAKKKEYSYEICFGPIQLPFYAKTSWHLPYLLDISSIRQAAQMLEGHRDFSAFCNARSLWDRSPICYLENITIFPLEKNRVRFLFLGDHFLYKMARNLAGTLAYCGAGKYYLSDLPKMIDHFDRTCTGPTAPAHALCLERVLYDFSQ
jgi:tRNA pseudouridine38-40 synthase